MDGGFTIRAAVTEDAEAFVRAHEAAWDAAMTPIVGRSLAELAPFGDRVARFEAGFADPPPEADLWVAERDQEIVGIAVRLGPEVRDLYVVPAAWGSGVAQALLNAAVAVIRGAGAAEAILWVGAENARARRFYEREGWSATDETRASLLGPAEVRYRLPL